jgi:hypothetical protein
MRRNL